MLNQIITSNAQTRSQTKHSLIMHFVVT